LLTLKFSYKENTVCNCCRNVGHFVFCIRHFTLHLQQLDKDKQNVDCTPPGKLSADAHGALDLIYFCKMLEPMKKM